MRLYLTKKNLGNAPRADVKILGFQLAVPALAWTETENVGEICYVRLGRRRIAHEVEHNLADFDNADHHPWWHFCGRVGHAIRLRDAHLNPRSLEAADDLIHMARTTCYIEGRAHGGSTCWIEVPRYA